VRRLAPALRSRFTLDRIAIAVVLLGVFFGVRSLTQGSESAVKADHAAALVPKQALFYVHVRTDADSAQLRNANEALRKLPAVARLRDQALRGVAGGRDPGKLESQVRPWLGGEAALALLPSGNTATSLILLEVSDRARAEAFLNAVGRWRPEVHRGTPVRLYNTLAAAFVGDFLAIGRAPNVRGAIDARATSSLRDEELFKSAVERLDLSRPLLYAYTPEAGVRRLLQRQPGLVGRLGDLLSRPGLRGVAAAVRFEDAGLRVAISSELVPLLPGAAGGERSAFKPKLTAVAPADTIAYLGVKGVEQLFERLSALAGGRGSTLARTLVRLRARIGPGGARALRRAVRPLRDRESALVVTPPAEAPVVSLVVGDTSRRQGGDVLVALQPLFARLLRAPQQGQVPSLEPRRIGGVDTVTLQLLPGLELTYAAFGSRIVVSTSLEGIRRLEGGTASLARSGTFAPGLGDFLARPTSVVFLDLHRLSALVERAGLGTSPEYRSVRPDISRIGTVSVITTSERSSQTAQVFIEVP
jgi:uncharacterized protein DUF3352